MPCNSGNYDTFKGRYKKDTFFNRKAGSSYKHSVLLPCGVCDFCISSNQMSWVVRNYYESLDNPISYFLSFMHLEQTDYLLDYDKYRLAIKDLRFHLFKKGITFRQFYCGHYGGSHHHPHYHMIFYGPPCFTDIIQKTYPNGDLVFSKKTREPIYKSPFLESISSSYGLTCDIIVLQGENPESYLSRIVNYMVSNKFSLKANLKIKYAIHMSNFIPPPFTSSKESKLYNSIYRLRLKYVQLSNSKSSVVKDSKIVKYEYLVSEEDFSRYNSCRSWYPQYCKERDILLEGTTFPEYHDRYVDSLRSHKREFTKYKELCFSSSNLGWFSFLSRIDEFKKLNCVYISGIKRRLPYYWLQKLSLIPEHMEWSLNYINTNKIEYNEFSIKEYAESQKGKIKIKSNQQVMDDLSYFQDIGDDI